MERLKELISQLKEQFEGKAAPSQMLLTTQLLEAELRVLAAGPARAVPTKITVMMPSAAKIVAAPFPPQPEAPLTTLSSTDNPAAPAINVAPVSAPAPTAISNGAPVANGAPATNGTPVAAMSNSVPAAVSNAVPAPARSKEPERGTWPFDPLAEKPTDRFTLSQKSREINDIIGGGNGSSLNEKLKSDIVELKSALNDTPVRDLRKAIGVNDRYVFINQLFRGDEVMYERSIKTINGFRILPEAEYWMERELKVKLGWDENREATRHFYQLVKRRFS
jgi:hypothetical protein